MKELVFILLSLMVGQNQNKFLVLVQSLLDAVSPPAPSRVVRGPYGRLADVLQPTTTLPGLASLATATSPPRSASDSTMTAMMAVMVLIFLLSFLSFLWFLPKTTIVGGAPAPTRADKPTQTAPPTESRWDIFSSFLLGLVCVASCAWLLVAKIAVIEGELAAQAAAFSARLIEQVKAAEAAAAAAANAHLGLTAQVKKLVAELSSAKKEQRAILAAGAAAAEAAADDNIGMLARIHELAAQLNGSFVEKNAALVAAAEALATAETTTREAEAAALSAADKYSRLQTLHEALQASFAQVSRELSGFRRESEFFGPRRGGFMPGGQGPHQPLHHQQQQQQRQWPQQQQRGGPSSPYAANPGAAFGQFPRRQ